MIRWSVVAALGGVLATWTVTVRLHRVAASRPPEVYWLLGLAALLPAWLIAFLGLLGHLTGRFPEKPLEAWWILSASAAILGVILTDGVVRKWREATKASPPARYWLLGMGAFAPAWGLAVLGLLWIRYGK